MHSVVKKNALKMIAEMAWRLRGPIVTKKIRSSIPKKHTGICLRIILWTNLELLTYILEKNYNIIRMLLLEV